MADGSRRIEFSEHARARMRERGASEQQVMETIHRGLREPAKHGRWLYSATFTLEVVWRERRYTERRISAIVVEEPDRDVVITVFVFYLPSGGEP